MGNNVKTESRTKKTFLNARVNLLFYMLTLVFSFFSRRIFLETLGADFVGLTGALYNLLGFLNLAELGIGIAIGYVLYKPIYEHDHLKINEIISVMGYLYRIIGYIILGAGLLLSCFLPWIFPTESTGFPLPLIYFAYYSFLISSLIGYFINYRQNLLSADQRNYVVTAYFQTAAIIKTIIQMALAYYTGSYYLWVALELLFGIVYSFILNWKINQTYPWLKSEIAQGRQLLHKYPEVKKYTKQLFIHKIADMAQYQTAPFFIYTFVSLEIVAFYGNYTILTTKIRDLFVNFFGSTSAGIGNLVAEGDKKKIYTTYWDLMTFRMWFALVAVLTLYKVIPLFITLWVGEEYLLSNSLLVIILFNFWIEMVRGNTDSFLYSHGLFYDVWAPFAETGIYMLTALVGGYFWGIYGIVLASSFSLFSIVGVWKPYFLFKKGFQLPIGYYWSNLLLYLALAVVTFLLVDELDSHYFALERDQLTWLTFILYGLILGCTVAAVYFILLMACTKSMRRLVQRVRGIIRRKRA